MQSLLIHFQVLCASGPDTLAYAFAQLQDAGSSHPLLTFSGFSLASIFVITR